MDEKKVKELCVRATDRMKEALEKGDTEEALRLVPELTREDRNMFKLLSQVISQFLAPFIQERFIEDQKKLGAQIEEAVKQGDKKKATELLDQKFDNWIKIHDIYVDFMGDTFGYIYDTFGKEALFDFYRKWGEDTKDWFVKRAEVSRDELMESGSVMWREHIGATRIERDKDRSRFYLQPCGSGGRRLKRIEEGKAGKKGVSLRFSDEFPLAAGARRDVPMYCTHCPYLFEVLSTEWVGEPVWTVNPPQKVGDPCIIEAWDRKKEK